MTKERVLCLVDEAVAAGCAHAWACRTLGVSDDRLHRWRHRRETMSTLENLVPGGDPVHALLDWEEAAILSLVEDWGPVDRSHRKLAHRGSRLSLVWVSPSTVRRVLIKHELTLPKPARTPAPPPRALPDWVRWEPNRIWIWDVTHFTRCKPTANVFAIVDVVSRLWVDTLVSVEESTTQVKTIFASALEAQGLLELVTPERVDLPADDPDRPILLAWSDNGPQMTSGDTREFFALLAIAQHHGRPGTPTDQAIVESFFGHIKGEWPHLERITDMPTLIAELDRVRLEYNSVRLHASIGYVTPDDEHHGRGPAIRAARKRGLENARRARIEHHRSQKANRQENQP